MWLSDKVKLKPKQLAFIQKNIIDAAKLVGIKSIPEVVIISSQEMSSSSLAAYNPANNIMFVIEESGAKASLLSLQKGLAIENNVLSTFVHELYHKKDADWFKHKYGEINSSKDYDKYINTIRKKRRKRLINSAKTIIIN